MAVDGTASDAVVTARAVDNSRVSCRHADTGYGAGVGVGGWVVVVVVAAGAGRVVVVVVAGAGRVVVVVDGPVPASGLEEPPPEEPPPVEPVVAPAEPAAATPAASCAGVVTGTAHSAPVVQVPTGGHVAAELHPPSVFS